MKAAVLVSGTGSNLRALIEQVHGREVEIVAVASDRDTAPALDLARDAGIPERAFAKADFADRVARDAALADWLTGQGTELVITAGYMALLEAGFIARFRDRIVNVHPSLLPAFPGVRAIEQAIDAGARVIGVTVHLVDEGVDTGAIIFQQPIDLPQGASGEEAHALLQPIEHELLPRAVRLIAAGAVRRDPANPRRLLLSA
jgi:phosphoribosylglycinamide formyltransferase-1